MRRIITQSITICICLTVFSFLIPPLSGWAQTKELGEITGKIIDVSGEELVGANVVLKPSDSTSTFIGTVTDVNGKFKLSNIPFGRKILVISYIGYSTTEITVSVQQGIIPNVTVRLEDASGELQEVVVRGKADIRYSPLLNSTDLQLVSAMKFSEGVLAGISNEQISKSNDRDASQIVQRIAGVSLVDRFVVVRGMDTRYNLTMINGIIGPSSEENTRAFSYDALPTGVIDRIEVEKSPGPHLPAMWGGGVVKIFTRNFTQAQQFNFDFSAGYRTGGSSFNDQFLTYDASNKDWFGNGAKDRRLPLILRQPYFNYPEFEQYPTENISIARSGLKPFTPKVINQDVDKRMSGSYYDSWKIGRITVNSLTAASYTHERLYQEIKQLRNAADYDSAEGTGFDNTLYIDSATNKKGVTYYREYPTLGAVDSIFEEQVRVSAVQSLGVQFSETSSISGTFFYNRFGTDRLIIRKGYEEIGGSGTQTSDEPNLKYYTYSYEQRQILLGQLGGSHVFREKNSFDWTVGYSVTKNEIPNLQQFLFYGLGDNAQILAGTDNEGNRSWQTFSVFETEERCLTGRLDYKRDITSGIYVKAGALYDRRERSFFSYRYTPFNVKGGASSIYFTEPIYKPWEVIDSVYSPENFRTDEWFIDNPRKQAGAYFFDDESTEGYVSVNYPILEERLTFYGGARVARFSRTLYDQYNQPTLDSALLGGEVIYVPDRTKTYFLPSGMLKYSFNDGKFIVRGVYGHTVDRPQFREQAGASSVNPGGSVDRVYDFRTNESLQGNPALENTLIKNADLRFEYYPKSGEFISVGAFYKHLDNPIQRIASSQEVGSVVTITYLNGDFAELLGFEMEVRKKFDFLKIPVLKDMSLNLNASYIWSESTLKPLADSIPPDVFRLQGSSPYLINAALYYENDQTGSLVSIIYNLTWDRIRDYSDNIDIGNLVEGRRHQIDLVFKQRITDYLRLKVGVQDVLNLTQRFYRDQDEDYNYNPGINNALNVRGTDYRGDFAEREFKPGAYYTLGLSFTMQGKAKE